MTLVEAIVRLAAAQENTAVQLTCLSYNLGKLVEILECQEPVGPGPVVGVSISPETPETRKP